MRLVDPGAAMAGLIAREVGQSHAHGPRVGGLTFGLSVWKDRESSDTQHIQVTFDRPSGSLKLPGKTTGRCTSAVLEEHQQAQQPIGSRSASFVGQTPSRK